MYAIIETGGKQYRVENGDFIYIEKLDAEVDSEVTFDKVVAVSDKSLKVGKPYVKDAFVKGTVVKKGSSRKMGHRQPYTKVQITEIG